MELVHGRLELEDLELVIMKTNFINQMFIQKKKGTPKIIIETQKNLRSQRSQENLKMKELLLMLKLLKKIELPVKKIKLCLKRNYKKLKKKKMKIFKIKEKKKKVQRKRRSERNLLSLRNRMMK